MQNLVNTYGTNGMTVYLYITETTNLMIKFYQLINVQYLPQTDIVHEVYTPTLSMANIIMLTDTAVLKTRKN